MLEKSSGRSDLCLCRLASHTWRLIPLLCLALAGSFSPVHADTQVGGPIISDVTWTLANSPYVVVENVDVLTGFTLTIEPGVTVRFYGGKKIQVNGTLVAQGTAGLPITFTSSEADPQPGDWANIEFTDTSTDATYDGSGDYAGGCVLQHCIVEYGGGDVDGAIQSVDAAPLIDHSEVHDSAGRGLYLVGTEVTPAVASNNTVSANQGGIRARYAMVLSNVITNNSGPAGAGVHAYRSTVSGNRILGNESESSWADDGGGVRADESTVSENLIAGNSGNDGGGVWASAGSTVANNIITGNSAGDGGGVFANGTAELIDNVVAENQARRGGGICVWWGAVLSGNTITANTVPADGQGSGVYYYQYWASGGLYHNTIVGNTAPAASIIGGVGISRTPEVHYNNLYGNSPYDVVLTYSSNVSGTLNYWGTTGSVDILEQVHDWYDDDSLGKFLYIPYLQDPDPDAPVPPPLNLAGRWQHSAFALDWDPIPSTTAGFGYKVYYDTDGPTPPYEGTGLDQGDSPIDAGSVTEYVLTGLEDDLTYYVAVTAYDTLGREGWYSNVVNSMRRVYLPVVLRAY